MQKQRVEEQRGTVSLRVGLYNKDFDLDMFKKILLLTRQTNVPIEHME